MPQAISGGVVGPGSVSLPFSAVFTTRQVGKGYSPLDGFGLIDALSAVNAVGAAGN